MDYNDGGREESVIVSYAIVSYARFNSLHTLFSVSHSHKLAREEMITALCTYSWAYARI